MMNLGHMRGVKGCPQGRWNTGSPGEEEFQAQETEQGAGAVSGRGSCCLAQLGCKAGVSKRRPPKSFIDDLLLSWVKRI